jgi:hypothetical protein
MPGTRDGHTGGRARTVNPTPARKFLLKLLEAYLLTKFAQDEHEALLAIHEVETSEDEKLLVVGELCAGLDLNALSHPRSPLFDPDRATHDRGDIPLVINVVWPLRELQEPTSVVLKPFLAAEVVVVTNADGWGVGCGMVCPC